MCLRRRERAENQEAVRALEEAHEQVVRVKARDPEVREVATALREMRRKNHFAEQLMEMMLWPKETGH